jgi:dipeptidyl aminopeptidase/acylaminoacyl peptidase
LIYGRDFNGDENFQIFCVDVRTGKTKALTPFKGVKSSVLDDLEDISDDEILFTMNKNNVQLFDVYRLNVITGEIKLEVENFGNVTDWGTDHNGVVRIAICSDGVNTELYYRQDSKSKFKRIMKLDFKNSFDPMFFTFDNKNIYAASNIDRDKTAIVEYDPQEKAVIRTVYQNNDVDVSGLHYSKKRKVLLSVTYYTDRLQRVFLDKEIETIYNNITAKLPKDLEVALVSNNMDEDRFVVRTYSDKTLGSFYLYDVKTDKIKKLTDVSPWLKADEMADMIPIQYKSRDGLTIHGYLTVPKVAKVKNLSVVVNPHGGPWARDHWGFDPEVQFLANRGYAVLQMNYRGSTGYGKKFWQASFKQWGLKMQDDITDGVKWLVEQGIADPKNVAIYGGSYGGYAVLAGLTFSPDVYTCGVDYVGVSNLFTFMNTIPPYWKPYLDMFHEMVGDPEKDKDLLTRTSPVMHVNNIKVPLLIAQGAKDPRVNINESNQMVDALRKRGINVPYMVKANEGHGFHNEENRMDLYREMEKFLKGCLDKK